MYLSYVKAAQGVWAVLIFDIWEYTCVLILSVNAF
jgi:hypothetical protein